MKFLALSVLTAAFFSFTAFCKTGPTAIAYVEVNDNKIGNVGRYTLTDGSPVFDVAIIFAANINSAGTRPVLYFNPQVQATLNDQTTIQSLKSKGIKVVLSILGNHQDAGWSNFQSYAQAQDFAAQVKTAVQQYNLSGVDIDDEYSNTTGENANSIGWAITALRAALGSDKIISFYAFGPAKNYLARSPSSVGSQLSYAWNAVYSTYNAPTVPGLSKTKVSAAAVQFGSTSQSTAASFASRTKADGLGVYMTYALDGADRSAFVSAFTQNLYGQKARFV